MTRHFLDVDDLTADELTHVLSLATQVPERVLAGRGVGLLFEKPSVRTRHSTEMAVVDLGGHPITVRPDEVGLDTRETAEDVARTLASYHSAIGARVFDHSVLVRMANCVEVPVVNLLSDKAHPLQAIADLLTIEQACGGVAGRTIAYIGDGANNVCRSLATAAALAGAAVRVGAPVGYQPSTADVDRVAALGGTLEIFEDPTEAAAGADVVYTDVWVSMGDRDEVARKDAFAPYSVSGGIMAAAATNSVFLHCLPAHRGEEVAAEVIDGPRSRVWEQAANRRSAARAVLWFLAQEGAS